MSTAHDRRHLGTIDRCGREVVPVTLARPTSVVTELDGADQADCAAAERPRDGHERMAGSEKLQALGNGDLWVRSGEHPRTDRQVSWVYG